MSFANSCIMESLQFGGFFLVIVKKTFNFKCSLQGCSYAGWHWSGVARTQVK